MCEHLNDLGLGYIGIFCIYCGKAVQDVTVVDGQLVLRREGQPGTDRYLAVVKDGYQKEIAAAAIDRGTVAVRFAGGGQPYEVAALGLVKAIQAGEEMLEITEAAR